MTNWTVLLTLARVSEHIWDQMISRSACLMIPVFLFFITPTHLSGYGFPAGVFLLAPSPAAPSAPTTLQPPHPCLPLATSPVSATTSQLLWALPFPPLSFIGNTTTTTTTEVRIKQWHKTWNLGQSCECFDVECAKDVGVSPAVWTAFCSVTGSVCIC